MTAGVTADRIEIKEPFAAAVDHILETAEPGDLVVMTPYDPRPVIAKLFAMGGRDVTDAGGMEAGRLRLGVGIV
jgi:hypothetical protein